MELSVLCVCTGNICRSPAMELLLARHLDSSVRVSSAGTRGLPGAPVHPPMARLLEADGVEVSGFRSRPLTAAIVREAGVILTATAAHRAPILDLDPTALRRTLTLGELGRLAPREVVGVDDTERLRAAVTGALAARPRVLAADPRAGEADDIVDPYGFDDGVYGTAYAQITAHVDRVLVALRGTAGGDSGRLTTLRTNR